MAEDTSGKDVPEQEIRPSFSQRVLFRIPFLKDKPVSKEPDAAPQWYISATEGMSSTDQQAVGELRKLFTEHGTPQRWYYSGSGGDISPTFVAPFDTEHWMVDVGYDATHRFFHESYSLAFSEPYQKLGGRVETTTPWDEGWRNKRQTVVIDDKTRLQLVGGKTQDRETTPDLIDVIYTNPYSTTPGPDAWIALKTGGYYIVGSDRDDRKRTRLLSFNKSLEDLGVRRVRTVKLDTLHYPQAGKIAGTTDSKPVWYQVYEKSRPFTPEEEDMLQLDSSLWEIGCELDDFIYRFDTGNFPEDIARKMEADLSTAFARYLDKVQNLKGNSDALSQQVQARVGAYFPEDGTMPESFRQHYLFEKRDKEKVIRFHQKAAEIYRQTKSGQPQRDN